MLNLIIDKFNPGKLVMTAGVNDRLVNEKDFAKFVFNSVQRHLNCDWGDMEEEDKTLNYEALNLEDPGRLFSAYEYNGNEDRIYIITEFDRSSTTILFPSEY